MENIDVNLTPFISLEMDFCGDSDLKFYKVQYFGTKKLFRGKTMKFPKNYFSGTP